MEAFSHSYGAAFNADPWPGLGRSGSPFDTSEYGRSVSEVDDHTECSEAVARDLALSIVDEQFGYADMLTGDHCDRALTMWVPEEPEIIQEAEEEVEEPTLAPAALPAPLPAERPVPAPSGVVAQLGQRPPRPPRLEGAVRGGAGAAGDPFCKASRQLRPAVLTGGDGAEQQDEEQEEMLPALGHLAVLEEAVCNGSAFSAGLPALPRALRGPGAPRRKDLPEPRSTAGGATARALGVPIPGGTLTSALHQRLAGRLGTEEYPQQPTSARTSALRSSGGGLLTKAPLAGSLLASSNSPRLQFSEDGWGVQPPSRPGSRAHTPTAPLNFGCSALRGVPLQRPRRGPAATAQWISTERERLRSEGPKPLGISAHIAFLQGPEKKLQGIGDVERKPKALPPSY